MFLFGIYFYPQLPDKVPVHWNYEWVIDRTADKGLWVFMIPIITLIMVIMFKYLPKLDPKKENYEKFEKTWEIFQFIILGFFVYAYIITTLAPIYSEINVWKLIPFGIGIMFIIMWNYMWKIRQNYFVWIKLPWTIANEEVWNKTHRLGGKTFIICWIIFIINTFFLFSPVFIFGSLITLVLIVPIVYSYIIYKNVTKSK